MATVGTGWFGTKTMVVPSPATPRPGFLVSKTKPTQPRWCGGALVVSANPQRRRHRYATQNEAEEEIGGIGQAVLAALKSGPTPPKDSLPETPQTQSPAGPARSSRESRRDERRSSGQGGGAPLSGSDVLLALQRAAVQRGNRSGTESRKRRGSPRKSGGVEEDATDYSNVRPLSIKSDWGVRLDELERRLQELQQL